MSRLAWSGVAALSLACAPAELVVHETAGDVGLPSDVADALSAGPARLLVQVDASADDALLDELDLDGDARVATLADLWSARSDAFLAALPADVVEEHVYRHFPIVVLDVPDAAAAAALFGRSDVLGVDVDRPHTISVGQSLPLIGQDVVSAQGFTGAGTAVVVLDTGADWTQADLGSCTAVGTPATCRVPYAADLATEDGSRDANGHGTNVSSIVARVAPGAKIIALDVFSADGYGYSTDIIEGLDWAVANRAAYNVVSVNMSLGSGGYTAACTSDGFATSIRNTRAAGISVVVASGNNAYTNALSSPACVPESVSVGAVYDANVGPLSGSSCSDSSTWADKVTCFSNSASFLDVLAPGAMITAGGRTLAGTSMAAPHVAGALAVVRGAAPGSTPDDAESRLINNGTLLTDGRNGLQFKRISLPGALADCVQSISTSGATPPYTGGTGTVTLTAPSGCAWTATSGAPWITLSPTSGSGSGVVTFVAAANAGALRVGSVNVAGRSVSVTQAAYPPPSGALVINGGAAATRTAAVTLAITKGTATTMCLSNTSSCSAWVAANATASWSLASGAGTKTVSLWLRDAGGNQSGPFTDTIALDAVLPTNGTVLAAPSNAAVALSWSGYADVNSGISGYRVAQSQSATPPSNCNTAAWTGSTSSLSLTGLTNGGTYSWRVCAVDAAGNVSSGSTVTSRPAPEFVAPTGSVVVNSNAALTNNTAVTVALAASDTSGVSQACLSNTATCTSTWFAMTSSKAWTLGTANGVATVYAFYKDAYGNVSGGVSDTITVDSARPANGSLTATPGNGQVALAWTGFSDAGGIARYVVVLATGTTAPATCAGTAAWSGGGASTTLSGLTNGTTYGLRLCAQDHAGNLSAGVTAVVRPAPEYVAPTGTLTLAGGAPWTRTATVTATIASTDTSGVASMCLSNTNSCTTWVPFAATSNWTLAGGSGAKTVKLWLKDAYGNVSDVISDGIGLDLTAPTSGSLTAAPGNGVVVLTLSGASDAHSGLARSYVFQKEGTVAPACTGTEAANGVGPSFTMSGLTNGTTYTWRVCVLDQIGNVSTGAVVTSRPAPELAAPTGSVVVNGGAAWTNTTAATLTLSASDPSGVSSMCLSTGSSCTSFVPYAASTPYTLPSGSGQKTVKVWFRDAWGNTSATPVTDGIGVDLTAPVSGAVTGSATSGGATLSWSGFSDAHAGLASYTVVALASATPASRCATGTVVYTGTATSAVISGLTSRVPHGLRVCAVDAVGNVSTGAAITITPP